MELNFIKDNNKYVSEFEVSSDFNLHIERNEGGTLYIQQRTGNGQYDTVKDAVFKLGDSVIDYDFQALVYPKYIKIVSDINPIAYITSDGEVTEIKSQTKEVEVTANGTTQVAPDAEYSYLTGVTVKTNVPQSGGSGSAPSGGTLRFYSLPDANSVAHGGAIEYLMPSFAKANGMIASAALISAAGMWDSVSAVASDTAGKLYLDGGWMNLGELLDENAPYYETLGYKEITEEEFYNLG